MTEVTEVLYQWIKGISQRQITKQTGTSRNTVIKIIKQAMRFGLQQGQYTEEQLLDVSQQVTEWLSASKRVLPGCAQQQIQLHHDQVKAWLGEPYMTVRQIRRLMLEFSPAVDVSETSLHRYIKRHFPKPVESTVVLHSLPGQQAQVDFGYVGKFPDAHNKMRRTYAFVMTLSYSRHRFVCFVQSQDVATWIECHVKAFEFLGGVPQTVLLDNLKSGVLTPHIYDPVVNRSYAECARYYGFVVDPAKVRTPQHKGKVERSIQIVRQQILAGREFKSLAELNRYGNHWCKDIIAHEVTRTTGETPWTRFSQLERAALNALPQIPYEFALWQEGKVGRDQHITFQGSFYSVPVQYVGQTLLVKATVRLVTLYHSGKPIKVHQRSHKKGQWITDNEDIPEAARHYLEKTPEYCKSQAKTIGPGTLSVIRQVLAASSTTRLRKSQAILRLAQRYSPERLETVCLYALQFGDTTYEALERIIMHDLDKKAQDESKPRDTHELSEGAFLREPKEFLTH